MHVVMRFRGGPLDGSHEFEDNDDIMSRINQTQDPNLVMAMILYHNTHKGQVGKRSIGVSPAFFELAIAEELLDDMTSAGHKYQIIIREEDAANNAVEIVARYVPPE